MSGEKAGLGFARRIQCEGCPWRKAVEGRRHVDGFQKLFDAVMSPGQPHAESLMACHESAAGVMQACVGFLARLDNWRAREAAALECFDPDQLVLKGEQWPTWEEMAGAQGEEIEVEDRRCVQVPIEEVVAALMRRKP